MARRAMALVVLAVVVTVLWLGCVWPSAWSPDSRHVVFPVAARGAEGVVSLVMASADGHEVRTIAERRGEQDLVSPAAWSPDGRRLAYLRYGDGGAGDGALRTAELHVWKLDTGQSRLLWRERPVLEWGYWWGPAWLDRQTLAVPGPHAELGVRVLGLDGVTRNSVPLPEDDEQQATLSFAPNGRLVAWIHEQNERQAMRIFDLMTRQRRDVAVDLGDAGLGRSRPLWAPDGRRVYVAAEHPASSGQRVSLVAVGVHDRRVRAVWRAAGDGLVLTSIARETGQVSLAYRDAASDAIALMVVNPGSGEATPVHFLQDGSFLGLAVSPDGGRVAFCPVNDDTGATVGALVDAEGRNLRFVPLPATEPPDLADVVEGRVQGALAYAGLEAALHEAGVADLPTREHLDHALAVLREVTNSQPAAIFREAHAYGRLRLHAEFLHAGSQGSPFMLREALGQQLDDFLEFYPDGAVRARLREHYQEQFVLNQDSQQER